MRRRAEILLVGVTLLFPGLQARGEIGAGTTLFARGQTRLSLTAGYGSLNDKDYAVLGLGAGYYLLDGLEAGVDGEAWLGSKPHLYTISPEARYVLFQTQQFKPYIGGFYKRTFYDSLTNRDSAGARAGVISSLSDHAYLSAGLVYEHFFHCDSSVYSTCSQVYPEIGLSFSY
jgi:hypothetical protein